MAAPAAVVKTEKAGKDEYTVQRGDTLYGIARKYKMSIAALKNLNPKVADKIVVGQSIVITGEAKPKPAASAPAVAATLGDRKTHTIAVRNTAPAPAPKTTAKPANAKSPVVEKSSERPTAAKKPDPAPKPAAKPAVAVAVEELKTKDEPAPAPAPEAPKSISSIYVMDEVSLGDLAKKHGTTTEQLNDLNNWNYKSSLILARGSEVYVPAR
jgi:LysM repeat protein